VPGGGEPDQARQHQAGEPGEHHGGHRQGRPTAAGLWLLVGRYGHRGFRRGIRLAARSAGQAVAQRGGAERDLGGAARPPGWILGGQLRHEGAHVLRYRWGQRRQWPVPVGHCHFHRRAGEGRRSGQALIGDDSQRVQVAGRCHLFSGHLLRCVVTRRAHHFPAGRDCRRADRVGDAEVRDLHHAAGSEQQVGRLDIAVDQPRGMRDLQPGRGLRDDVHAPRGAEGAAGQDVLEGGSVHQFHHQIRWLLISGLAVVVDPRDVGMRQGPGMPCLGLEPGQGVGLPGITGMQQLDRDRPGQDSVHRAPHLAVAATADLFGQFVAAAEDHSGQSHQRGLPSFDGYVTILRF
jgi:hypothetical protein